MLAGRGGVCNTGFSVIQVMLIKMGIYKMLA